MNINKHLEDRDSKIAPRVSIGVPVYNGERYLAETLDSILAQTFTNYELIISDNGSSDRTQEICESYAGRDPRIRYVRVDQNRGAVWNFNRVVELAHCEYFKWAAYDDPIGPDFLERCVEVLDCEPSVILSYARTMLIDDDGNSIGPYEENMNYRDREPHKRWQRFFNTPGRIHPIFGVIRTHILRRTNIFADYLCSDRVLLGELTLYGEFHEIPEYLFYRRIHSSISWVPTTDPREFAAWLNPARKNMLGFPKWRRLYEYVRSITRAPISWGERIRCYIVIIRFTLVPDKWAGLLKDLLGVGNPV